MSYATSKESFINIFNRLQRSFAVEVSKEVVPTYPDRLCTDKTLTTVKAKNYQTSPNIICFETP